MRILVTGAAGFIGYHLVKKLCDIGQQVVGMDNLNAYYDVRLKYSRLRDLGIVQEELIEGKEISGYKGFDFFYQDLLDKVGINSLFQSFKPEVVIHLAAQAGVRHSIHHPQSFIDSNIQGFFNILEACRRNPVSHLVYASSSSVYGSNEEIPFKESAPSRSPVSLYGATKKAGEILAQSYVSLYKIPSTGLRFFTVYGPWGRPDMAYYKFADHIMHDQPIEIYNQGNMARDFTYIDDIIAGIEALMTNPPSGESTDLHRIVNIGRSQPVNLLEFVEILEKYLDKKAIKKFLPIQQGDVETTWADTSFLTSLTGYTPSTNLEDGIRRFVDWYLSYHQIEPSPILA